MIRLARDSCSITLAVSLVLLMGCNKERRPSPVERTNSGAQAEHLATLGGAMTLRFFDDRPVDGTPQKPAFMVSSPQCSLMEEDVWELVQAAASIYSRDDKETRMEANRGRYDNNSKIARLEDNVVVRMESMQIELAAIEWRNKERIAVSDQPLVVIDGGTQLTASGLRFEPDTQSMVLANVQGVLAFQEEGS